MSDEADQQQLLLFDRLREHRRIGTDLPARTGRKVGRTFYLTTERGPSDSDNLVGLLDSPALAAQLVAEHNSMGHMLLFLDHLRRACENTQGAISASWVLGEMERLDRSNADREGRVFWRTLVRVLAVHSGKSVAIEVPAWQGDDTVNVIGVPWEALPVFVQNARPEQRFHAMVNLGASRADDLVVTDWEPE